MIDVCLLPTVVQPEALAGHTVVVIDVLRATTTMAHALTAGAKEIIPCLEVDEARQQAEKLGRENILLGGERGGVLIEGFDLGNSPCDYTPETVGGRTLVFTTTNGTAALLRCRQAERIVLGSLVNRSSVADAVQSAKKLTIVCAGTRGRITREDVFAAGAIVEHLTSQPSQTPNLSATARLAQATWQSVSAPGPASLLTAMRESRGGRDLVHLGLDRDIADASQVDSLAGVQQYDAAAGVIRTA